ncbi:MAG: hypothetical protein IH831_01575 [Planctomycetes bacterium]|nr:hypothetical protein [Planctomycetota bacterium]
MSVNPTLELNATPLNTVLAILSEHLLDIPLEVLESLLDLFSASGEISRVESHTTAGTIKVTLHPSERLLEFLSTIGAINL